MSKSLDEFILGAENQALAHEAIKRAVEQAEAAGLPAAYVTEPGAMSWLEKDSAKLLEQRRAAIVAGTGSSINSKAAAGIKTILGTR